MNEEIKNEEVNTTLTDEQVHHIYTELSDVDKESMDNLAAAKKETEETVYTSEDNTEITEEFISGVTISEVEDIKENEEDVKDALSGYDLDNESMMQMLNLINDYKAGKQTNLYSKLPESFKKLVDNMVASENVPKNQKVAMRNEAAKILIDSFINDAKMSATIDEFSAELNTAICEMNSEYDKMISDAMDETFSKIEEIRAEDPEQAEKLESIKNAFDNALTFDKQLEWIKMMPANALKKLADKEYSNYVRQFNTRVNNNTFGVTIPDVSELLPIIKAAFDGKYSGNTIKKFILAICRTSANPNDLAGTAYNYRIVSSIYRYKFTAIDEKGEIIFRNISKVIEEI